MDLIVRTLLRKSEGRRGIDERLGIIDEKGARLWEGEWKEELSGELEEGTFKMN